MIILRKAWYFTVWILVKIGLYFFYKKITVTGRENIPKGTPVIFAANHENAFIDAFLVATHNSKLCNFLVRADVFRSKLVRLFFTSLNMQPVYRIRDGFSSLKSNEEIFESCYNSFGNGESLIMFPEGTHDKRRIRRKLTKGISRLALGAMNAVHGPKELFVVPVGLDYSDHDRFRSTVQINFGKPVSVQKRPMESKFFSQLRDEIEDGLRKTHIAIPDENYETLNTLIFQIENQVSISDYKTINEQAQQLQKCIHQEKMAQELDEQTSAFIKLLEVLGTMISSKKLLLPLFLSILMFPIFIYALILNSPVLLLIYLIDKIIIKDKTFIASINFSIGFILLPILWTYIFRISSQILNPGLNSVLLLISLPISLIVFQAILNFYTNTLAVMKLRMNKKMATDLLRCKKYLKAYKTRCLGG